MATGLDGYSAAGGTSNSFFDGTSDGFSSPGESRQPEIIELPTPTRRRRVVSCPLSQRVYRGNPKNGYRGGSADSKGRQLDAERQCKCRNAKIWQGQAGILATVFRHKKTSANSHTRGLATNTNRCGTCSSAQGRIAKLMGRSSTAPRKPTRSSRNGASTTPSGDPIWRLVTDLRHHAPSLRHHQPSK